MHISKLLFTKEKRFSYLKVTAISRNHSDLFIKAPSPMCTAEFIKRCILWANAIAFLRLTFINICAVQLPGKTSVVGKRNIKIKTMFFSFPFLLPPKRFDFCQSGLERCWCCMKNGTSSLHQKYHLGQGHFISSESALRPRYGETFIAHCHSHKWQK